MDSGRLQARARMLLSDGWPDWQKQACSIQNESVIPTFLAGPAGGRERSSVKSRRECAQWRAVRSTVRPFDG
jgi:hypothetical protein